MKFADCELAILRHAVEKTEQKQGVAKVNNPEVKKMLSIVEDFLRKKQLICYGGTAINNILPKHAQFYKREIEMPDYDSQNFLPVAGYSPVNQRFLRASETPWPFQEK